MINYRFDPYIGRACRAGARGFTVSHCLGRSRRRPTEESQTHLRVATQVCVGGLVLREERILLHIFVVLSTYGGSELFQRATEHTRCHELAAR